MCGGCTCHCLRQNAQGMENQADQEDWITRMERKFMQGYTLHQLWENVFLIILESLNLFRDVTMLSRTLSIVLFELTFRKVKNKSRFDFLGWPKTVPQGMNKKQKPWWVKELLTKEQKQWIWQHTYTKSFS